MSFFPHFWEEYSHLSCDTFQWGDTQHPKKQMEHGGHRSSRGSRGVPGFKGVSTESIGWWKFPLLEFHGESRDGKKAREKISRFDTTDFCVMLFLFLLLTGLIMLSEINACIYGLWTYVLRVSNTLTVRVDYDFNLLRDLCQIWMHTGSLKAAVIMNSF